jgi:hypothetical protein
MRGAYDEASDRRQDLSELMSRAYEDALPSVHRAVVGAKVGEQLAKTDRGPDDIRVPAGDRLFGA